MKRLNVWTCTGWAAALPILLAPIGDPDVFWHLSAGEWMLAHGTWPRADWLSFTLRGAAWADFEWLAQLIFLAAYKAGGYGGLWLLKGVLLAAVGEAVRRLVAARSDVKTAAAAVAVVLTALVSRADIRVGLFSLVLFAWVLWFLETRAAKLKIKTAMFGGFALFALWANLHAGFAYGLALIGLYAVQAWWDKQPCWRALAAAVAAGALGALVNPYGAAVYGVLFAHAADTRAMSQFIVEWGPLSPARRGHWPLIALLVGAAVVLVKTRKTARPVDWAALVLFGAAGALHARLAAYAALLAVPMIAARLPAAGKTRAALGGALAASALFGAWCTMDSGLLRRVTHTEYLPVRAAAFIEQNAKLIQQPLYHPWGWGGYLGGRVPVFQDGRYIFTGLLAQAGRAAAAPASWQAFLDKHGVQSALMLNLPTRLPSTRQYPDGSKKEFMRPYYLSYMPREKWALVYWDRKALLFVRRAVLRESGLEDREYRLARPGDRAALRDALSRGEIDVKRLEAERARHADEVRALPDSL